MKKLYFTLSLFLLSISSATYVYGSDSRYIRPHITSKATATSTISAYYHTPMGVTFKGADKDEKLAEDIAFAPANKWLETAAVSGSSFEWYFPKDKDASGNINFQSSTKQQLSFRIKDKGLYPAPLLTVSSGTKSATYTMAADGIEYGAIGSDDHFAVNYQPGKTTMFDVAPDILNVNDKDAENLFNMIMQGGMFTDIHVHGFAESFYDCGQFYLQEISAEVYSAEPLTIDDICVKVFKREMQKVYTEEIANLNTSDIHSLGNNRYYVTFTCNEPAYIVTAMQVVVMPAENSGAQFSPVLPLQSYYSAANAGTCSLYADFTFAGKKATKQYLDFFGTEVTDENNKTAGYLNHWAIGIKGSYDKPSAISETIFDKADSHDTTVYSILGLKVGTVDDIPYLAPGIYICRGKKILKR